MTQLIDIKVPDIGDYKNIPVIEIFVKVGDTVAVEDALLTLESDKATLDVPSSHAGVVREIKVKVGDKISEGSIVVVLETSETTTTTATATTAQMATPATESQSATTAIAPSTPAAPLTDEMADTPHDLACEMLVLGAGPGGYSAAFRAADLGMDVVLVERYATLGGVCLNVGCIPSKALLHSVAVMDEARHLSAHGISFAEPQIDIDKLRDYKDSVVNKLTTGLAGMAKMRKVNVVQGVGQFIDPHHLQVTATDDEGKQTSKTIRFKQAIIAAGSRVVKLPFIPEDPRIVDSTGALELRKIPKKMLILGGGIIGLEMGTVYSSLGARLDVVEMMDGLMQGADRDLVKVWQKHNAHRFDNIYVNTKTVAVQAKEDGIYVTFEKANDTSTAPTEPQRYDMVLVAVGRAPNGLLIGAERAGVAVNERGFISTDAQMRTNVPHIFAIGDIVGQPMLAHKAVHEAHVAAEAAHGEKAFFDVRQIPSVAYTDPEVAWAGLTEEQAKAQNIAIKKGVFPWQASGRAIANGHDEGFTKLIFDATTGRILGGGIVGTGAGDLISEICLAIEMGADSIDIGKTIHPHPTLGESIGMAAEVADGHCTDVPPVRRK
ncbi:MAG: dihydrolipoyl dehydrogenase [Burkholderiales bacterium]|nr:dihydrolipoyl dehydrogenase [Burkholderiales bacterium]